jgi:hypothetical protein
VADVRLFGSSFLLINLDSSLSDDYRTVLYYRSVLYYRTVLYCTELSPVSLTSFCPNIFCPNIFLPHTRTKTQSHRQRMSASWAGKIWAGYLGRRLRSAGFMTDVCLNVVLTKKGLKTLGRNHSLTFGRGCSDGSSESDT